MNLTNIKFGVIIQNVKFIEKGDNMKIDKFDNNRISKLKNTKLFKGVVIGGCALMLTATLAGCGEKEPILKDTILDSAVVATVDGDKEVLRRVDFCSHKVYSFDKESETNGYHEHYVNVISGEFLAYSDGNCYSGKIYSDGSTFYPRNVEITNIESITNYLTEEEYKKALDGKFTREDAIKVLAFIKSLPTEVEDTQSVSVK